MTQTKSPNGKFPTFPFNLPVDGEFVTEDALMVSDTSGQGWIGKLIDAVGWLKDRAGYTACIATDGIGGCVIEWQSGDELNADWILSVNDDGVDGIAVTMATTFVANSDFCAESTILRRSNEASLSSKRYPVIVVTQPVDTKFVVQIVSDTGAAINTSTEAIRVFVRMTKKSAL